MFGQSGSRTIEIQVNDGSTQTGPLFGTGIDYRAGSEPQSVAAADINGDGKQDLVVAHYFGPDNVSLLLGNGDGTFQAARKFAVGANLQSVAIAELNGDGKLDLAVVGGTASSGNVAVLLGNGDGTFGAANNYVTGSDPRSVAIGDLNGDGKLDLAVANSSSANVSLLLGSGDGTFGAANNYVTGSDPRSVAIGDLNGDGKLDLAVANSSSGNVSLLLGNGDGTFQTASNFAAGAGSFSVATADLNRDGKLDLAIANVSDATVSVLIGNGNGTFQAASNLGVGISPQSVVIADINGDGRLDLAVLNQGSNSVSVLNGNGDGTFQSAGSVTVGGMATSAVVGDFNGNGGLDLAVTSVFKVGVSVLLNISTNLSNVQRASVSVNAVDDRPTGSVTISGTATQGQTLTATNTLANADGLGKISYQWVAAGVAIAGATANTFTLTQAQVGKTITVTADYTDGTGRSEAVTSSATGAVANVNDAPTGGVTITGLPIVGRTLAASNNLADADGLGAISYQWSAAGVVITGATASTYTLTPGEAGKAISVTASYIDGQGAAESVAATATGTVQGSTQSGGSGNGTAMASVVFGDFAADMRLSTSGYSIAPLQNFQSFVNSFIAVREEILSLTPTDLSVRSFDAAGNSVVASAQGNFTTGFINTFVFQGGEITYTLLGNFQVQSNGTIVGFVSEVRYDLLRDGSLVSRFSGISVPSAMVWSDGNLPPLQPDSDYLRGNDAITGSVGNDYLLGYAGSDSIFGGAGKRHY